MNRKIAFFDIDGTLTSEIDGSIPKSVKVAIAKSRENGHLMFINTGRCMQNVEKRFRDIGFDGFVCGCGTNIYCRKPGTPNSTFTEIFHLEQPHNTVMSILKHARNFELDLLFESKNYVCFDMKRPLINDGAIKQYNAFINRGYDMNLNPEEESFSCDKFVIWFKNIVDIPYFCEVSDKFFDCIDRGGNFREFVPKGYSKSTGITAVLDYYNLDISDAFALGDSNNDLPMLLAVPNSIAMGNASPASLLDKVSFVTKNASDNGIEYALKHFNFI